MLAGCAFGVLCGDVVAEPLLPYYEALETELKELELPVLIAPGNHDSKVFAEVGDGFRLRYGRRSAAFAIGADAFLLADTVEGGGDLTSEDMTNLKRLIEGKPRRLFLFLHHLIWIDRKKAAADPRLARRVNGIGAGYAEQGHWDSELGPMLESSGAQVFVIAGDVGARAEVVDSYERPAANLVLLSSGMGDHSDVGSYLMIDLEPETTRIRCRRLGGGSTSIPEYFPLLREN